MLAQYSLKVRLLLISIRWLNWIELNSIPEKSERNDGIVLDDQSTQDWASQTHTHTHNLKHLVSVSRLGELMLSLVIVKTEASEDQTRAWEMEAIFRFIELTNSNPKCQLIDHFWTDRARLNNKWIESGSYYHSFY